MPSVWIERRETTSGRPRYLVKYRLGGRESAHRYAGSFQTRREALARSQWVAGELAAMRVPQLSRLAESVDATPTLAEAAERWRASRVDVTEGTAVGHRVQLGRILPLLGALRVDEITPADVAEVVATLHAAGRKRETIRKSLTALAQVLDYAGVKDNPARDRVHVRLPRQEREEPTPPTADQIEAVLPLMPSRYALAVLVLDATGMRVGEVEALLAGDLDEPNTRWRIRRAVEKGRRGRWVSLPADLFDAVLTTLPPRGPRSRAAGVSGSDSGAAADGNRAGLQSLGHADMVATRPSAPADRSLASARRDLGADRRPRWPALALRHSGHVHARAPRRPRAQPCRPRIGQ